MKNVSKAKRMSGLTIDRLKKIASYEQYVDSDFFDPYEEKKDYFDGQNHGYRDGMIILARKLLDSMGIKWKETRPYKKEWEKANGEGDPAFDLGLDIND
jgi:hypothetical protein